MASFIVSCLVKDFHPEVHGRLSIDSCKAALCALVFFSATMTCAVLNVVALSLIFHQRQPLLLPEHASWSHLTCSSPGACN